MTEPVQPIAELEAAATPGPWVADVYPEGAVIRPADRTRSILRSHDGTPCLSAADARLIVALRNSIATPAVSAPSPTGGMKP